MTTNKLTVKEFVSLLKNLGFKLRGSYYLGLNGENSDIGFMTTDSHVYNKTMKLL